MNKNVLVILSSTILVFFFLGCFIGKVNKSRRSVITESTPDSIITSDVYVCDTAIIGDMSETAYFEENYTPSPRSIKHVPPKSILKIIDVTNNHPIVTNEEIKVGQVIYKFPDTMLIYQNYRVVVRISKDSNITNITDQLEGTIRRSEISVSSRMEVTLKDEDPDDDPSFKISKINSDQQIIENSGYTEWIFNIQPLKRGDKKLNLVISVFKGDRSKQIVYTDIIFIKDSALIEARSFLEEILAMVNWYFYNTYIYIPLEEKIKIGLYKNKDIKNCYNLI